MQYFKNIQLRPQKKNSFYLCVLCICFSYVCDEYVNNASENKEIIRVRQILRNRNESETDPLVLGDDNAVDFNSSSMSNSLLDDDQVSWKSGNSDSLGKETQENSRSLRPRSRKR